PPAPPPIFTRPHPQQQGKIAKHHPIPISLEQAEHVLAQVTNAHQTIAKAFRSGRLNDPDDMVSWGSLMALLAQLQQGAIEVIGQRLCELRNVTALTFPSANQASSSSKSRFEENPHFPVLKELFDELFKSEPQSNKQSIKANGPTPGA
ncbi:MAG: hypothetical protein H7839_13125, partial [Magnetococcus sp. YQC-5]